MSFRTLRFGDRTISYDAGLNLVESEGKTLSWQNMLNVLIKILSETRDYGTHFRPLKCFAYYSKYLRYKAYTLGYI